MKNGRETVLLVAGDGEEKRDTEHFLEKAQYEVIRTPDAMKALNYLKDHPHDADIVLGMLEIPSINGIEMLKLLKLSQRMKDVPVVLIIDRDKTKEQEEAMASGAEDVILYPFAEQAAEHRIRNILAAKRRPAYVNVMEEIVKKELDNCIAALGMCKCSQCRNDVMTLALNRLKPRYVSSEKGRLLSVIDQMSYDYIPDILRALTESAEIVKKSPRHEKTE